MYVDRVLTQLWMAALAEIVHGSAIRSDVFFDRIVWQVRRGYLN